jgi:hypothetical protein
MSKRRSASKDLINPPLQPLRIPSGWNVEYNTFSELDPKFRMHDDASWNFGEDMLHITNRPIQLLVDLGWYPAHRSKGRYRLKLVRLLTDKDGADWDHPLEDLRTRSRRRVVAKIEEWLHRDWSARAKRKP